MNLFHYPEKFPNFYAVIYINVVFFYLVSNVEIAFIGRSKAETCIYLFIFKYKISNILGNWKLGIFILLKMTN